MSEMFMGDFEGSYVHFYFYFCLIAIQERFNYYKKLLRSCMILEF